MPSCILSTPTATRLTDFQLWYFAAGLPRHETTVRRDSLGFVSEVTCTPRMSIYSHVMKPQAASRKGIVQRYIASHGKTMKNSTSVKIAHEGTTRMSSEWQSLLRVGSQPGPEPVLDQQKMQYHLAGARGETAITISRLCRHEKRALVTGRSRLENCKCRSRRMLRKVVRGHRPVYHLQIA